MQTLSDFYQSIFSCKVYKLSLDAGCTCPNRDGSKGRGGCIFCSPEGSGEFAASRALPVADQVREAKSRVLSKVLGRSGKRPGKFIAYFQNFTSTYGDAKVLAQKYREALACQDVVGLALATRPDCLGEEILSELAEISKSHFVQIELGLQTSNEKTGRFINRCYSNEDYLDAVRRIRQANPAIHIVTHLIFGLPGEAGMEGEEDMLESARFVARANAAASAYGIKITVLYVVSSTPLEAVYRRGDCTVLSKESYFDLLKKALPLLGQNCVIHRLTGDPCKKTLVAPLWPTDKKRVLNELRTLLASIRTI